MADVRSGCSFLQHSSENTRLILDYTTSLISGLLMEAKPFWISSTRLSCCINWYIWNEVRNGLESPPPFFCEIKLLLTHKKPFLFWDCCHPLASTIGYIRSEWIDPLKLICQLLGCSQEWWELGRAELVCSSSIPHAIPREQSMNRELQISFHKKSCVVHQNCKTGALATVKHLVYSME